ncbi:MAG: protein kinase [Chloroflexota bacterium]|nr:protein kinase [Chloroflexota bacterium]
MADVELRQVGLYTITGLLKEGSTGSLYQGRQQQRKKDVVIKVIRAPLVTTEAREAFVARAKQLKKLTHRHIIGIQDFGLIQDGGAHHDCGYLVMAYAQGGTIREHFTPGQRVEPVGVKTVLSAIGDALNYAHVNTIVHANLHPANLFGTPANPLLANFALSVPGSPLPPDNDAEALLYGAPEYLRGAPVPASDQYALAVMVYEWLCGRRPYEASSADELLRQQEQVSPPPPSSFNDAISPAVEQVLLQALARVPEQRFPHTQAFSYAYLRSLMGLPVPEITPRTVPSAMPTPATLTAFPATEPLVEAREIATPVRAAAPMSAQSLPQQEPRRLVVVPPIETKSAPVPAAPQPIALTTPPPTTPVPAAVEKRLITITPIRKSPIPSTPALPLAGGESWLRETMTNDLGQGGILSETLPGYEERPAQIEMAKLVARALTEDTPAIIEAATGTGKSLAYLVPIVRSGKVAIVSTANKALQEQLFYKDIPFVQQHIKPFEASLVKGMANYICLDRLEGERVGLQFYAKNHEFQRLLELTQDTGSDFTGDFEALPFPLPLDIKSRIFADGDQCAWGKCGYFLDCYVRKMRLQAEQAQIIVVNHTLLLLDAAMEGHLLPERDMIVLDEAHHLEEEATRAFTVTFSPGRISTLLAQRMLKDHSLIALQDDAVRASMTLWQHLEAVANPGASGRVNLREPVEEGLRLATIVSNLADSLRKQRPKDMPEKETSLYDKLLKRTQNLAEDIRTIFSVSQPEKFVYYVERIFTPGQRSNQVHLQVSAAPLDITAWLQERLFDKYNVICTSATLATTGPNPARPEEKGPNFAYFRRRIGLDPLARPDVLERILPLTFDYESNALLYLPRNLPEPAYGKGEHVDAYTKALAREMYHLVRASRGRAFLLFSSKRMLDSAYDLMAPHLDFLLLRQGDLPRIEITRKFKEESAVLFGLKSFWEGVDIPGEALSLVVIDKLPFDPPDDPVHEARVAQMKAAGENWFGTYVLPQAVLRLKQGLGRLLRTRDDRGVMALLDARLHTKGYGKQILNALPPARRTSSIKDVERFFAEELEEEPF